jgi:hypothetical protein
MHPVCSTAVTYYVSATLRSLACAASLLALCSGAVFAQSTPSPTPATTATAGPAATPTTQLSTTATSTVIGADALPPECQVAQDETDATPTSAGDVGDDDTPDVGGNHGQRVKACVAALRAALGNSSGLGQTVSEFAHAAAEEEHRRRQTGNAPATHEGSVVTPSPTATITATPGAADSSVSSAVRSNDHPGNAEHGRHK